MIFLITGASHTGKTLLAQKLLEKYHCPYLCMDHIKMGLIRSGNTVLTPYDDGQMTEYLWPIVREMIKTAVENGQDLIVEGCYVPEDWEKDFSPEHLIRIKFICIVMTESYIRSHFDEIIRFGSVIENRNEDSDFDIETAVLDNKRYLDSFGNSVEGLIIISDCFDSTLSEFI